MYNIKQAAARAGVSVPVLRAWERRYGVVRPIRTASNYRQYDDAAIARIQAMRSMVEAGWSPSAAAAAILAGQAPVLPAPAAEQIAVIADPTAEARAFEANLRERLVRAAAGLDTGGVDEVLDDLFARGTFERVASELLFPALEALGDAWARGEVSVAGEHLASAAVHRRLAGWLEAAGTPLPGPQIIVGLPPGGRHELGALAFAVAARRAGLPVAYLGADLPIDDWATAARAAWAAVIGVVTARDRASAQQVASRLHAERPELLVAAGGRGARTTDDMQLLTTTLADSVATLREWLGASPQVRVAAS